MAPLSRGPAPFCGGPALGSRGKHFPASFALLCAVGTRHNATLPAAFEAAAACIVGHFFNTKRMATVRTIPDGVVGRRLAARAARLRFVGYDPVRERRHHFASVWDRFRASIVAASWCSSARVLGVRVKWASVV